jgi:hypothetical protein
MTFDGSGNYTITGKYAESGVGENLDFNDNGTYSVNSDGKFTFTTSDPSTIDGAIAITEDLFIFSNVREINEPGIGIGVKVGNIGFTKVKATPWIPLLLFDD